MKKMRFINYEIRYPKEAERLVEAAKQDGYIISLLDAHKAWEKLCDDYYCAGWIGIDTLVENKDDLAAWKLIKNYFLEL